MVFCYKLLQIIKVQFSITRYRTYQQQFSESTLSTEGNNRWVLCQL